MTSNYPPDGLYPEGLHRDRMLPAIELLKEKLDVLQVDGGTDYRLRVLERIETYFVGIGSVADAHMQRAFEQIVESADENPVLRIEAREIRARRRAGGVVWFDFAELCGGPRSHNDYLEIASQFHAVLLSNVPRLSAGQSSEARRFTWLVDILYDCRVKLIISAAAAPNLLYVAGSLANEFERAVSRLIEMQSREYAALPRRPGGPAV
jgi:cell division protein ZapE